MKLFQLMALGSALAIVPVMAQTPAAAPAAKDAAKTAAKEAKPAMPAPTAAEISDAKSKGLVWVNLNTKKYHQSTFAQYGATKRGKFMTEADAKKEGFEAAQDHAAGAGKKAAKAAADKKQ